MMVYQNLLPFCCLYCIRHCINTTQSIEIQTTDYFSLSNQFIGKFFVAVIEQYIFATRHPSQKVGESIRHNDIYRFIL